MAISLPFLSPASCAAPIRRCLLSSLTKLVARIFVPKLTFDPFPYDIRMCICEVIYLLAFFFCPPLTFKWATSRHIESFRQLGGDAVFCVAVPLVWLVV